MTKIIKFAQNLKWKIEVKSLFLKKFAKKSSLVEAQGIIMFIIQSPNA